MVIGAISTIPFKSRELGLDNLSEASRKALVSSILFGVSWHLRPNLTPRSLA